MNVFRLAARRRASGSIDASLDARHGPAMNGPMTYAAFAGRQLYAMIFIIASAGHFSAQALASAAHHGVPMPELLVPLSGVIALVGGVSVLLGFHTRFGAALLVIFLVPVTLMMHNFWDEPDATIALVERAMFMKNMALLGGALLINYFGAGPLSLDALTSRRPVRVE